MEELKTTGTVLAVRTQWWLKINTKPVRTGPLDGAIFPHIIKVQYTVNGKTYFKRRKLTLLDVKHRPKYQLNILTFF